MSQVSDEFEISSPPRQIDTAVACALDEALADAAGAPSQCVVHAIDPKRILRFEDGGPPVWSVAVCPSAMPSPGHLYLTFGLSRALDPESPFLHELSIRVGASSESEEPPAWPVLLLRHLARYQRKAGSELCVGDPIVFADSITRAAVAPLEQQAQPDSEMRALAVVADPELARTVTEVGNLEVRRVYGLYPDELEMSELWSCAGTMTLIGQREGSLTTRLDRTSWTKDTSFVAELHAASEREGSLTSAVVVPGLRWERTALGHRLYVPAQHAPRLLGVAKARLGFARTLLVHDYEPRAFSGVALEPRGHLSVTEHDETILVIGLERDASPIERLLHTKIVNDHYVWVLEGA